MSLNIDDINTVSDLLNLQEKNEEKIHQKNVTDNFICDILDHDPSVGIEVCVAIIKALREFHGRGVDLYIAEGNPEHSAQWASDHAKLEMALNLISDIQV